jgi:diguanylate cyclase (GGDEF)-like protein
MLLQDTFFPQAINSFVAAYHAQQYSKFIFFVYAIAVLVKAYLLCFNVFYHMPPRMKRSTRFMLFSISMLVFFVTLSFLWHEQIAPLLPQTEALNIVLLLAAPVVFFCVLYPLFEALRFMPASDVIVTSREFVVGSLATTILVLSRTMRILDWNKKGSGKEIPLLKPLFRESFEAYRQRLLAEGGYRVSPHNENILTLMTDEQEMHFLLQIHEAKTTKKHFGYIVEVTEVSPIYTTLRYFEEIAYLDTLTKLYNRNAYITHVSETIKAENMPLLILVGDVNHLKQINDTHGHLVGDRLLTIVSDIISQAVDENAFVARVGGDEFVLLLPRGSKEVAESFIKATAALCEQVKHEVFGSPSLSWGYAVMDSVDQSYNEVLSEADAMMYAQKKVLYQFRSSGLLPDKEIIQDRASVNSAGHISDEEYLIANEGIEDKNMLS